MGARQRAEASLRAVAAGEQAYREGKSEEANPYRTPTYRTTWSGSSQHGAWSLHRFWALGWNQGRNAAMTKALQAGPATGNILVPGPSHLAPREPVPRLSPPPPLAG